MNEPIAIRSIQHYLYCPHRWRLIEIDRAWSENVFVTKANIMHERVHDPDRSYISRGRRIFTSVTVANELPEYNIYGKTDCIELIPDKNGVKITSSKGWANRNNDHDGKYKLNIVEYKPTKPKERDYNPDDVMQVFAQKICVDYMFGCSSDGYIYYSDVRNRVLLPLNEKYFEYAEKLKFILAEMRAHVERGKIPKIRKDQKCSGCSMKDMCMPKIMKKTNVRQEIEKIERSEKCEDY